MSFDELLGKSLRPMVPANTRSPERTQPSVTKQALPGVCPGVCMTSIRKPANVSTSPSISVRTSFTGTGGTSCPAPHPCGSDSAGASASWM
jgi:hypothetical protein